MMQVGSEEIPRRRRGVAREAHDVGDVLAQLALALSKLCKQGVMAVANAERAPATTISSICRWKARQSQSGVKARKRRIPLEHNRIVISG